MIVAADEFLAYFVGPDDEDSCDGCSDAVQNNPYSCEEVPEPGEFECGSRCRHMVQMEEDAPDDFGMLEWRGLLGFGDFDLGDATSVFGEELDSLVTQDNLTKADVQKFLDDSGLTMGDLAQEIDPDDYQTLVDALGDDGIVAAGGSLSDALASADIDAASDLLKDPDQIAAAIEMGKNGINDDVTAYALADALTDATGDSYVPKLKNNTWYVTTGDLTEVGTAASGNWGHAGRPGQVGGSAGGTDVVFRPGLKDLVTGPKAPSLSSLTFTSKDFKGTLYHGTQYAGDAIKAEGFKPSSDGAFGPGVYLSDNEDIAHFYSGDQGTVIKADVSGRFAYMTSTQYEANAGTLARLTGGVEYARSIVNAMFEAHGFDGIVIEKMANGTAYYIDEHPSTTVKHIESEVGNTHTLYILFKKPASMREGGPGSGNHGHLGRPGQRGGSAPGDKADKAAPGAEEYSGPVAPWDMKADAEPRYPGDDSIYSPALKDATDKYVLGRRLQGTQTGKDPNNQIVMYTFIPGSATPDQLSKLEGMIKDNSDHAQLHPGEIAYNDENGVLQKIPGNNYWIRGDKDDLEKLHDPLTAAVKDEFGAKNAWTIMMSPETPAGVKVDTGEPTTHMRVVVPFTPDTPPNTVGTPSLSSDTRDKIMSVMAGDDRRVWQHADFNGMHIATNIDAKDQDELNAKVRALGGELEPEEQHHNLGATRFIPKNLNIEDYEVRESMTEGGPGSGNYGHDGRPGQRGGSMPGDRKQAVFMIGGPASGKGATVAKNYPTMMHIDPDAVKQSEPMYSDKTGLDRDKNETPGLYGPSGPHNAEEFAKYPQAVQDAQTAWIRANTPFSDAEDFAARGLKTPGNYQGGLTHELSSYIAKNQLDDAIAKGERSFVFDSVGSEKYKDKADAARKQGFDVTFHRVYAPEDKAWQGNLMRGRSVDPDVFHDAHEKARNIAPILQAEAKARGYHWRYTDNTDTIFQPHEL